MQGLGSPLIHPRVFELRAVYGDKLIGLALQEIEPRDHGCVGALRKRGDVIGGEDGMASETLEYLNIAGDVGPYRYDLSVALNGVGRPP